MGLGQLAQRPAAAWRSDNLDLLRALLALYVIFVHLAAWKPGTPAALISADFWLTRVFQSNGETNPAVLVFIVLSGYCIHRNGARLGERWSVKSFAIRRWFRIVPVFVLATVFAATVFEIAKHHAATTVTGITSTNEVTAGCLAAKLSGAAALAPGLLRCSYQANAPLNTVMVEIWLYVVYGLGAWWLVRRGREGLALALIAVVWLAGFAWVDLDPADLNWWSNSSLVGYLVYWWVGATMVGLSRAVARSAVFAGVIGWFAITLALEHVHGGHLVIAIAELRKVAFAIAAAGTIRLLDRPFHLPRALTALGRSGYSLYALHAPLVLIIVVYGLPWWLGFLLPISVAIVSYRLIERPGMQLGRRLARRAPRSGTGSLPYVDSSRSSESSEPRVRASS